ncbi:MAG: RNA polymerase sigma factor [Planctomycetota bacterium]
MIDSGTSRRLPAGTDPDLRVGAWGMEGHEGLLWLRLEEVRQESPSFEEALFAAVFAAEERTHESVRDGLSTRLMELFRLHQSRAAFGLLYELNAQHLLIQVASRLRRYQSKADPGDVLQEVFVNIYRYPHRFDATRDDAFRVWTSTIVRNTVLKHLRSLSRSGRAEVSFDDLPEPTEERTIEPARGVIRNESERECTRVYLTYLHLYLRFYSLLSEREQRALQLVEVEESSYRDAAADLGIKLENLKMVIFRARRKIHRSMKRVFEGLPPDMRPARDPRRGGEARSTGSDPKCATRGSERGTHHGDELPRPPRPADDRKSRSGQARSGTGTAAGQRSPGCREGWIETGTEQ